MARVFMNFGAGKTSAPVSGLDDELPSPDLAAVPVIAAPHYMDVTLDPGSDHGAPEIVGVTVHPDGATSATMERGKYGTTQREHPAGTTWRAGSYAVDFLEHVILAESVGILPDGSNQSSRLAALIAAIEAAAGDTVGVIEFGPDTYRFDSGFTFDPRYVVLRGSQSNRTILDFTNLPAGQTAFRIQTADSSNPLRWKKPLDHLTLAGSEDSAATTIAVSYGGASGNLASLIRHDELNIVGFGYHLDIHTSSWLITWAACGFGHSQQAVMRVNAGSNSGEQYTFFGGVMNNNRREVFLSNSVNCGIVAYGTSFDYNGRLARMGKGSLTLVDPWIEGDDTSIASFGAAEHILCDDSAGGIPPSVVIRGGTIVPLWTTLTAFATVAGGGTSRFSSEAVRVFTGGGFFSGAFVRNTGSGTPFVRVKNMEWTGGTALATPAITITDTELKTTGTATVGALQVSKTGAGAAAAVSGDAGQVRDVTWQSAGVARWVLRANGTAESGSDAGSDLVLVSRTDAGAAKATLLTVFRALGRFVFGGKITTMASAAGDAGLRLPPGVAPSSPEDGDLWYDGTDLKFHKAGVTKTVTLT